jgi:hypothetical protein
LLICFGIALSHFGWVQQANFPTKVPAGVDPNASPLVPFMLAMIESNVINRCAKA